MAASGSGGARRISVDQSVERILSVLQDYCLTEPRPFDLGGYKWLRSSQAASGLGLVTASGFLSKWVTAFPDGMVATSKFISSLDTLVSNGTLGRFLPSHGIWDGLNVQKPEVRKIWCERVYTRCMVALNHLRRIHGNVVKKQQALRGLPASSVDLIENILAKMHSPDKPKALAHSDSQRSCFSNVSEGPGKHKMLHRHLCTSPLQHEPKTSPFKLLIFLRARDF